MEAEPLRNLGSAGADVGRQSFIGRVGSHKDFRGKILGRASSAGFLELGPTFDPGARDRRLSISPYIRLRRQDSMFVRKSRALGAELTRNFSVRTPLFGQGASRNAVSPAARTVTPTKIPRTQTEAAAVIQTAWLRHTYSHFLDRQALMQRLELESMVLKGSLKLFLYSATLIVLGLALFSLEVPSSMKLAMVGLIRSELQLERLASVNTLDTFRDILPILSHQAKKFSITSSARFDEPDGVELVRERIEFQKPRALFSRAAEPSVTKAFTMAAWVERMPGSRVSVSLLRRPMASNRLLNCWAWRYPSELRYGAHDFFAAPDELADGTMQQTIVKTNSSYSTSRVGELVHTVITVEGGVLNFFRNALLIDRIPLPRPVTDCINPDTTELGDERIAMSAVKFYPRALKDHEVKEMFEGGAPLLEVATGSTLKPVEEDALLQVGAELAQMNEKLAADAALAQDLAAVNTVISTLVNERDGGGEAEDPIWPKDTSPTPVFPRGNESDILKMLPVRELAAWTLAERPTEGHLTGRWEVERVVSRLEGMEYWSVMEDPVQADGAPAGRLPMLNDTLQSASLSFWFKPHIHTKGHCPDVRAVREATRDLPEVTLSLRIQLDWVTIDLTVGGDKRWTWRYLTVFNPTTGKIDESFLLTAFAQRPQQMVWRHLVYTFRSNAQTSWVEFYLDGEMVMNTADGPAQGVDPKFDQHIFAQPHSMAEFFSNATIYPHSWERAGEYATVGGKIAQLRLYAGDLGAADIRKLHEESIWPRSGQRMRECVVLARDTDFYDSNEQDSRGHDCNWFNHVAQAHEYVCTPAWVKAMCPATCGARRVCHDGKLRSAATKPVPRRTFRIFDRIVNVEPRVGGKGVICPSNTIKREEVLADCRRFADTLDFDGDQWRRNFTYFLGSAFADVHMTDVRKCDELAARLDEAQCTWDGSWLPEFQKDYEETETWSLSFWVRPKEGSLGMPNNFWFAINAFSTLAPPLLLSHWNEREPQLEPWMDAYSVFSDPSKEFGEKSVARRGAIFPTTAIDYAGAWTFMHMQNERLADGTYRICASLNAHPMDCSSSGIPLFPPEKFLTAIEFTTEMLVSPIEITTQAFTKIAVQQKYYRLSLQMEQTLGPVQSLLRHLDEQSQGGTERGFDQYDQKVLLIAPPLLFQTRSSSKGCTSPVADPILGSQHGLIQDAHCRPGQFCSNLPPSELLVHCPTVEGEEEEMYFGLHRSTFDGQSGFTDFLFAIADNSILVRGGKTLRTRSFLDVKTTHAMVMMVLHSPMTGLTTMLNIHSYMESTNVNLAVNFKHVGYVPSFRYDRLYLYYGLLYMLVMVVYIVGIYTFLEFRKYGKKNLPVLDLLAESAAFDLFVNTFVLVFATVTMVSALNSESKAAELLVDISRVRFSDSELTLSDKLSSFRIAIRHFENYLDTLQQRSFVSAILTVLLLIRIMESTNIHPKMRLFTGTLYFTLLDLWHFLLLFMIVFCTFALSAMWLFGNSWPDFVDFGTSARSVYSMVRGWAPQGWELDSWMFAFVVLHNIVFIFVFLKFLLAIVMEGYVKVRAENKGGPDGEFLMDMLLSIRSKFTHLLRRWPTGEHLHFVLEHSIGSNTICARHLMLQGMSIQTAIAIVKHYHATGDQVSADQCVHWLVPINFYSTHTIANVNGVGTSERHDDNLDDNDDNHNHHNNHNHDDGTTNHFERNGLNGESRETARGALREEAEHQGEEISLAISADGGGD